MHNSMPMGDIVNDALNELRARSAKSSANSNITKTIDKQSQKGYENNNTKNKLKPPEPDLSVIDSKGLFKPKKANSTKSNADDRCVGYNAAELMEMKFPEPKWAIPGILTEGLGLLAGKPKMGKSIFALNCGLGITNGLNVLGNIGVENGSVLYLALEDTHRRLQQRIKQMFTYGGEASKKLLLYTQWPRMHEGGIELIEKKIKEYPDMRLVIIDTLPKFRPPKPKKTSPYDWDYEIGTKLKQFADENSVALLVICHLRKTQSEDRMDDISGTFGVTGTADTILSLIRKTGQADAELHVTGRDVEAAEYALTFDNVTLSWNIMGTVSDIQNSKQQQDIYDAIKNNNEQPISPKELEAKTNTKIYSIKKILPKLILDGKIKKVGHGRYIFVKIA